MTQQAMQTAHEDPTAPAARPEDEAPTPPRRDSVRLLSSDELASSSDFYDSAPCTD